MLELLAVSGTKPPQGGQIIFGTVGTHSWVVPQGVTSIHSCAIATGLYSGAGGGLSWRNNIPVSPGEVLTIVVPDARISYQPCGIRRGSEALIVSYTGNYDSPYTGGLGGKEADNINDGGGNGGNGLRVTMGSTQEPVGGGAGGYTGNGGSGGAVSGSGGGGGGAAYRYQSPAKFHGQGGGTGIIKQGPSGQGGNMTVGSVSGLPGSYGNGQQYGGGGNGVSTSHASGGVRIIWGPDRSYPLLSDDIVE